MLHVSGASAKLVCLRFGRTAGIAWLAGWLLGIGGWNRDASARADDAPVSAVSSRASDAAAPVLVDSTAGEGYAASLIDELVSARLRETSTSPASPSSDSEFVRRIYLDLVGRIPSLAEFEKFVGSPQPDKRDMLIDDLLNSRQFARHFRDLFDQMLVGGEARGVSDRKGWLIYLEESVAENKPWDQFVRELLLSDGTDPKTNGGTAFFVSRGGNVDAMTTDSTRLFLGVRIQCARCHDHPMVWEWTQDSYYGMAAFWVRSSIFRSDDRVFVGEKADGVLKFQPIGGDEIAARPVFLTGETITEPNLGDEDRYLVKPRKGAKQPPRPKFSLREQFAELTTSPENPYFQRAMVNRLFRWLIGRGLVEPIDDMHSENAASHPELLDALGRHFAENGFDLRRLIQDIVRSKTYQRSSNWVHEGDLPDESLLAYAPLKPLTPEQLALSLMQACGLPEAEFGVNADQGNDELWRKLEANASPFLSLFAAGESDAFQATAEQALFLTNSETVEAWIADDRKGSTRQLLIGQEDDAALIDTLFRSVLSRNPNPQERAAMSDFLESRQGRRNQAVNDLIWSLLTSSEFRFNH